MKWGNDWKRVKGEIILLCGRIVYLYRNDISAILSEGNTNYCCCCSPTTAVVCHGFAYRATVLISSKKHSCSDCFCDNNSPPPPRSAILFNKHFVAARHEKRRYGKIYLHAFFLFGKGLLLVLSNDDIGVARGAVLQEMVHGREMVSKPAISLREVGRATVERPPKRRGHHRNVGAHRTVPFSTMRMWELSSTAQATKGFHGL